MESNFVILTAADDWTPYLERFSGLDVYYSREYAMMFADMEPGVAEAAYYEDEETRIFYPYIKREIPLFAGAGYDIVTPYGYGGPHLEGNDDSIVPFYEKFRAYCLSQRIVTETVRLHPVLGNERYLDRVLDVGYIRKTTGVKLGRPYEEVRRDYSSMTDRNIKKAEKLGLECVVGGPEDLDRFLELYVETMDRNDALDLYYFDREYFVRQMTPTPLCESRLLFVRHEGQYIAGVILMLGQRFAHYHLGASSTAHLHLRPNNLLFDRMVREALAHGSEVLHLGGGYREDDGLFAFKASFTGGHHYRYHIGKNIYDRELYEQLTERARTIGPLNEGYFPLYRGIVTA